MPHRLIIEAMTSEAVCSKCGGLGFIITEHAHMSGATPCDCRAQGRADPGETLGVRRVGAPLEH